MLIKPESNIQVSFKHAKPPYDPLQTDKYLIRDKRMPKLIKGFEQLLKHETIALWLRAFVHGIAA